MIFYRIKQFYWGIESLFVNDDFELLNKYLNKSELDLFMTLAKSERQHSIRVCNTAAEYIKCNNVLNIDKYIMCKCALLHDIGKSKIKLNIFYKSMIIILNKITCGKFLKYNRNKLIINYYNHAQIGVELLQSIKQEDLDIINCIKYHHDENAKNDNKYLKILRICDNCN